MFRKKLLSPPHTPEDTTMKSIYIPTDVGKWALFSLKHVDYMWLDIDLGNAF